MKESICVLEQGALLSLLYFSCLFLLFFSYLSVFLVCCSLAWRFGICGAFFTELREEGTTDAETSGKIKTHKKDRQVRKEKKKKIWEQRLCQNASELAKINCYIQLSRKVGGWLVTQSGEGERVKTLFLSSSPSRVLQLLLGANLGWIS